MQEIFNTHPNDYCTLTPVELRQRFHIGGLFELGQCNLSYWYEDRTVLGGVTPSIIPLALPTPGALAADSFCERRELGIINLGGSGGVQVGDDVHILGRRDGLYLGRGTPNPVFSSEDPDNPARFYLVSFLAHATHPVSVRKFEEIEGLNLGSPDGANARTLYKYFAPGLVPTCQLVMGLTLVARGSTWNTIPPHTHNRRSEVYCYFGLQSDEVVMHFMGPPEATRHIVMRAGEAVLSPSWSIHCGAGTGAYGFVWSMGGENQEFTDMDAAPLSTLV